jgi:hypothetical protein
VVLLLLLILVAAKQPLETKAVPLKENASETVDSSKNKKSVCKLC